MRFAVLGAGFAGLAVTWHLLQYTRGAVTIDLFDPEPIGKGVSGLSSGLLHAYGGKHARRSWHASKGIDATHQLITEASRSINQPVILSKGILRPAVSDEQATDFKRCGQFHDDTAWWDAKQCEEKVPHLVVKEGGLFIKTGLTIDVPTYLEGLWQGCARLGTQFHQRSIVDMKELEAFDHVIFALGHKLKAFAPFQSVPIRPIKGQILELGWPADLPPLPFSLISQGYLVMGKQQNTCIAGATFEREFKNEKPDTDVAIPLIMSKITPFFPALAKAQILSCHAGIRATSPENHHLPLVGRISEKQWYITGLGSKGLLYHAWLGDLLAQAILNNDPSVFPPEVLRPSA